MGYYIETDSHRNKVQFLVANHGAIVIDRPVFHSGEFTTVVVVDNGPFEAAGIGYSPEEVASFARPDHRQRTWLKVPTDQVLKLNPHVPLIGNAST